MRRPVSEHDTTIRSRRRTTPEPDPHTGAPMEPVSGGRVRRIVFPGEAPRPEPAPFEEPAPEPAPPPRRTYRRPADMAAIEADVDRIIGRRRSTGYRETRRETLEERTVYETPRGAVRAAEYTTPEGRRKAIYLSRRQGEAEKERRFLLSEVDKVIADVPGRRERVVEETGTERVPKGQAPAREHEKPTRTGKRRRAARRGPKATAPPRIVEPEEPEALETTHEEETAASEPEYRPQCAAVTKDGKQCRNSAKAGSKYCGSHQGHRPVSLKEIQAKADTKPRAAKAEDTRPGEAGRAGAEHQAQCAAFTRDGKQCRNSSRRSSKYCSAHKGYRPPSQAEWERRMDTKPRVAKAKDTKPSLKRGASTAKRASGSSKAAPRKAASKPAKKAATKSARKATKKTATRSTKKAGKRSSTAKKAAKKGAGARKTTSRKAARSAKQPARPAKKAGARKTGKKPS